MRFRQTLAYPNFAADDGGAGGGSDASGGNDNGDGAGSDGGAGAAGGSGAEQSLSLRAQLASALDVAEREPFVKWADGYTTDKDFAKAAVNMRTAFDSRVPIPKPDDKPEVIDKFWQKVGKPAEAKAYNYDWGNDAEGKPRQLDDGEVARFEGFKDYAYQHNFTQRQFEAGIKFLEEDTAKQETAFAARIASAQTDSVSRLKQDWGSDYDDNLAAATDAGVAFADNVDDWSSFVNLPLADGVRVGDHPTLLRMMAKIGRANGEDQRVRNMTASGESEDIKSQIAAIEDEALSKGSSTSAPEFHKRLQPLYEKLYPKKHSGQAGGFGGR